MPLIILYFLAFFISPDVHHAQPPNPFFIECFNTKIKFELLLADDNKNIFWLQLHANETIAGESLSKSIQKFGGIGIKLINGSEENLKLNFKDKIISFDPNKIFTSTGIHQSLKKLNPQLTKAQCKYIADSIYSSFHLLRNFMTYFKSIVSLNNNNNQAYSVLNYKNGHKEFIADSVSVNKEMRLNNFILTNELCAFQKLKTEKVNVVYQQKKYFDDGSLLVWAIQHKKNYCDVETGNGLLKEQMYLLNKLKN